MPALVESFHEGETAMRSMLKVPPGENPTSPGLPWSYGMRVANSALAAVGTLDAQGRPWTTLWGGSRGFSEPIAEGVLGLSSSVDVSHDPVYAALWGGREAAANGGVVQPNGGQGKMMSALALDLESRDRVKLMGRMVAGAADTGGKTLQMAFLVTESLGNCPKYLNKKRLTPRVYGDDTDEVVAASSGSGAEDGRTNTTLPEEALGLLDRADMFFVSSTSGESMDTNIRGGAPGFVRVVKNQANEVVLVYPEYSGNRLYQTLGNLKINPLVGIVIPDFDTSDVLYVTGSASILVGADAAAIIAHTTLAVQITITASRFVKRGLPFRGTALEPSPYNPPVRHLLSERDTHATTLGARPHMTATLTNREVLSPTVNRFTFALESTRSSKLPQWQAGQHVTMDFSEELNSGYAHMADDDPQSLNDDYLRTFTISNAPRGEVASSHVQMQITARKKGPATGLLWRQPLRVPLEIPVLGFGGEAAFRLPTSTTGHDGVLLKPVFVAGGVGITPLLAQATAVIEAGVSLELLWSLNKSDLPLAIDTFTRIPLLAARTTIFVSNKDVGQDVIDKLQEHGVRDIQYRRMEEGDVKTWGGQGSKFYLCAGPTLLSSLRGWLDGETTVWEDFGY